MTTPLTRREFLKLGAAALLGVAIPRPFHTNEAKAVSLGGERLGRTVTSLRYYDIPSLGGVELGYYITDSVVKILEASLGDPEPKHNPIWLRTEQGWVHSSSVQPVREQLNQPLYDVPAGGFLAEVTVPWTQAWENRNGNLKRVYRFYYASTHWVDAISTDSYGNVWYRVLDDLKGGYYYALAEHMRRVPAEELTPISAQVTDKRVVVSLAEQKMSAYENGRVVFAARVSTGTFEGDTPKGEFRVERKQPMRHMSADEERGNGFDLPGVPWVCFIAWTGVSFHGTYWHRDFGTPRSHGCINMAPEAAKWLYRWTTPIVPPEEDYLEADNGTPVTVV
ncbi:MAG: L,D-transpeptidase [Anaerolineales bacterium]|nr:L,D-transpeptidase [Anaerolineales bacterium]